MLTDILVSVWQSELDEQVVEESSVLKQRTEELEQCKVRASTLQMKEKCFF